MKATILTIGDEILIGQTINTNAAWISEQLAEVGIKTHWQLSVEDELNAIKEAITLSFVHSDVIIMTGGLGPTKDDVTKKALADYFQCGFTFSDETYQRIISIFEKRNIPLTDAHREQCLLPAKAILMHNAMGTAPGMWFEKDRKYLAAMPGVPFEMKYIIEHGVLPRLLQMERLIYRKRTLRTAGIGETALAELIEPILENHDVDLAYLPSVGQVKLRLSKTGTDVRSVEEALHQALAATETVIKPHLYGYDTDRLEAYLGQLLLQQGKTIGTAESCTGGYIAHMLTSISGSSRYFKGSVIAYSNEIKKSLLHVPPAVLDQHGAVSEETVRAMVKGALETLGVDVAVAVSGISGPTGGTDEKPVGTVWIAVGDQQHTIAHRYLFTKDRLINIKYTAVYALNLIRKFLIGR